MRASRFRVGGNNVGYGNVISYGENSNRQMWDGCGYCRHAEMDAIKKLPRKGYKGQRITDIDLLVIRVTRGGHISTSKPCGHCIGHLQRIKRYRIRTIYYSEQDRSITKVKFDKLLEHPVHISGGFLHKERMDKLKWGLGGVTSSESDIRKKKRRNLRSEEHTSELQSQS